MLLLWFSYLDHKYSKNHSSGRIIPVLLILTLVSRYFTELTQKYPDGKMQAEDFKKIFHLAFPERKQDKV